MDAIRKARELVGAADDVVGARLIEALSAEIIRLRQLPHPGQKIKVRVVRRQREKRLQIQLAAAEKVIVALGDLMTLENKHKS